MALKKVSALEQVNTSRPTVLSIGVFDGVHLGHKQLVKKLVTLASDQKKVPAVLFFHPHPDVVLKGITDRFYLTSPEERSSILHDLGVKIVITLPFDEKIRLIKAKDFVAQLSKQLQLSALVQGENFALGYRREGNITYLSQLGNNFGFSVHALGIKQTNSMKISSQRIRTKLLEGSVEFVRDQLLGRSYSIKGKVIHGKQRGRTLGFPTINLQIWDKQLLPANGTYACWATLKGGKVMALANLGLRPSFEETQFTFEAFLVNFNADVYGEEVSISFEKFLRPEMKFADVNDLKLQIKKDVELGVSYLSSQRC